MKSANSKPHTPRKTQMYAPPLDGRSGRVETKSDLYVLAEVQALRVVDTPTVFRRRVPEEIAMERGFVLAEAQFGHLNFTAINTIFHRDSTMIMGKDKHYSGHEEYW